MSVLNLVRNDRAAGQEQPHEPERDDGAAARQSIARPSSRIRHDGHLRPVTVVLHRLDAADRGALAVHADHCHQSAQATVVGLEPERPIRRSRTASVCSSVSASHHRRRAWHEYCQPTRRFREPPPVTCASLAVRLYNREPIAVDGSRDAVGASVSFCRLSGASKISVPDDCSGRASK